LTFTKNGTLLGDVDTVNRSLDTDADHAPSWRPRVGIVAPVKQEAPYLLEWIAYHRALGVETFMLGDNGGTDHTSELLQALDSLGIIKCLDWRSDVAIQSRFYADAIPRLRNLVDVCAIVDLDEFLHPLGGHRDIPTAVSELFDRPDVSAAALHWALYGSGGRVEPGAGLIIERFTQRAADDHLFHKTVKSLVRPERFDGMLNPHVVVLTNGEYIDDHSEPVRWAAAPGTIESVSWCCLRVDHFVLKSRREFEMKVRRGRAGLPPGVSPREEDFFISRDRNEINDPMPADFVRRTKDEMARLRERLKSVVSSGNPLYAFINE
jgi:hypothetical protein